MMQRQKQWLLKLLLPIVLENHLDFAIAHCAELKKGEGLNVVINSETKFAQIILETIHLEMLQ